MPSYDQASFLGRAVRSLLDQSMQDWELIVVDDGSPDDVPGALAALGNDSRVRYVRLPENRGLGSAVNTGADMSRAPLVAYLPCDDVYDEGHLAALLSVLADEQVVLAWSGVRHHDGLCSLAGPAGHGLQLVQVMHRRSSLRWPERGEMESDDLERLFFDGLRRVGRARGTGVTTCAWTDHPHQRHKTIRERYDGGLNVFRDRYRVSGPLRLHSTDSGMVDEIELYRRFRERDLRPGPDALRVLLLGELSVHPERVLALAERGVRLFGLWTPDGLGRDTVGPLPFGHVTDLPRQRWREALREVRPDVIYGQLNWRAVPFAARVLRERAGTPFVWHFKESPHRSIQRGEWPQLAELCVDADAVVFSTPQERDWFRLALPGRLDPDRMLVIDGSLPNREWFSGAPARRLSDEDGEVHTAVLGRPLGLDVPFLEALVAHGVHVHFHGLSDGPGPQGSWRDWLEDALEVAGHRLHVHPAVDQRGWVSTLSRYDAGWMHRFTGDNGGDLRRATWDDLNHPGRIGTLMAAGLPMLQQHSPHAVVAVQELIRRDGIGLLYRDAEHLAALLRDDSWLTDARKAVTDVRHRFTFDEHADTLLRLFQTMTGR